MAVSSDGSRLAAVAADGSVFFFLLTHHNSSSNSDSSQPAQQRQMEPLVGSQLGEAGPTCCCWDVDGSRLLVGFSSGVAVEVAVPAEPGTLDTSRCGV